MSSPSDAFHTIVHPEVMGYLAELGRDEDPLVGALEAYAIERRFPLVGRASGRVLALLTRLIGGRRVFEFGSGFGFSAYYFASAVGEGGEVVGSERNAWEFEAFTRLYQGHPLAARIHIHPGDAFEIFDASPGLFDVVFLDLHKLGYPEALRRALPRVRPGGLILADNVLWGGRTARSEQDPDTVALSTYNRMIMEDARLESVILPVGDGLAVSRVRDQKA